MKRLRLLAVLCLLACAGDWALPVYASGVAAAKTGYRIVGVVVNSRDGAPVPYCRVQVVARVIPESEERRPVRGEGRPSPRGGPGAEAKEVEADVHGRFQAEVDGPGLWALSAEARGFRRQGYDAHEGMQADIALSSAAPTANVTFRLERDGVIAGMVLDEAGEPVRNAQITAEARRTGSQPTQAGRVVAGFGFGGNLDPAVFRTGRTGGRAVATTDDRGRYELSGLAPGEYRVRVSAQPWYAQRTLAKAQSEGGALDPSLDMVYATVWFPGADEENAAEWIPLAGGEERQADFHLVPLPATHLQVPLPVSTAATGQEEATGPGRAFGRGHTGAVLTKIAPSGGSFTAVAGIGIGGVSGSVQGSSLQDFGGLSPGTYELRNGSEVRQFKVSASSSGVMDLSTSQLLTRVQVKADGAGAGAVGQVSFVNTATGQTAGQTINAGGFGRRRNDDGGEQAERAVFLLPGRWEVRLAGVSYLAGMEGTGVKVEGGTVEVGSETASLLLHLGTGRGQVSGIARDGGGHGEEGAMVLLVPATLGQPGSTASIQRDESNSDGSFTLRGVVPGRYILLAIEHGWGVKWQDATVLAGYLVKGIPVEVGVSGRAARDVPAVLP